VVFVTESAANVVVYVDEKGEPYSTTTEGRDTSAPTATVSASSTVAPSTTALAPAPSTPSASATPAPAPAPVSSDLPLFTLVTPNAVRSSATIHNKPATTAAAPAPSTTTPASVQAAAASAVLAPPTASTSKPSAAAPDVPADKTDYDGALGVGITYDPFIQGGCRSADDIASEFSKMKDYKAVRIYANDCNLYAIAIQNALKNNQKLMAGVYLTNEASSDSLGDTLNALKMAIDTYAGGKWDVVQLFSVENEQVNDKQMSVSDVVNYINQAREQLRSLGFNGPVGAVETVPATLDNPALCQAADVVMVNCHPFFDTNTAAKDAGSFVKTQIDRVKSACNNKRVVITETGWPHQGNANGKAVPSPDNQRTAIDSIRSIFSTDVFFHNAFDSNWKTDSASTFNAEQYWGILQ
jgi:exo-beta-1,3-glucanase (GH17 family)